MNTTCHRCDSEFEPHTPNTPKCTVCTRYDSLRGNASKTRKSGYTPGLDMTRHEFAAWFATQDRVCTYCDIPEDLLPQMGYLTQVGLPLARLGMDRLDNAVGYRPDNIALCCFACNKVRSNIFTVAEMRDGIGPGLRRVWMARLAAGSPA